MPIVAFMAGRFMDDEEMQGMSFGHAGTIVEGVEDSATEKIARLEAAGIPVVERIDEIPDRVKEALAEVADERRSEVTRRHLHRRRGRRFDRRRRGPGGEARPRSARSTSSPPTRAGSTIVRENLDECVLCNLCVDAAPAGTIRIVKLYE